MAQRNSELLNHTAFQKGFMGNPRQARKRVFESMYIRLLTELCVNRFTWIGLPSTIDVRFLEMRLFYNALAIFYYDAEYNRYFALRGTAGGTSNMYDNPTSFTVIGNAHGPNKTLNPKECVPIWANYNRMPDLDVVMVYASRLAEFDRTVEINSMQQRKPFVISAPESQRLTVVNALKQQAEGEFAIVGNENFDMNSTVQAFNTGIDKDLVLNTLLAKQKIWNECMTLLGINNANQDKRERLVADEVAANDEQVGAFRLPLLNARLEACEQINRMYGLSVSVEWNKGNGVSLGTDATPDNSNGGG